MKLDPDEARARFAAARAVRLATAGADGRPHVVPVTFALLPGDVLTFAVDHKPKTTTRLRRLANIVENPAVSLLADAYDEDWTRLWWARADGRAVVLEPGTDGTAELLAALSQRYDQYRGRTPEGPVVRIDVARWSGWSGGGRGPG